MTVRRKIHLTFSADVETEEEAWAIAEGLEAAATKRDYVGVNSWVEYEGRENALGSEAAPPTTAAETMVRQRNDQVTAVGDFEGSLSPLAPGTVPND
jgi:hypothetical protein